MSKEFISPPEGYWKKDEKVFIFSTAATVVLFLGGLVFLLLDILLNVVNDVVGNSFFYYVGLTLFVIGIIPAVICATLLLNSSLSVWQYRINKRRGLPDDDKVENPHKVEDDMPAVLSPLRGAARDFEPEIVAELRQRASLKHPRANVAQLLRALIDMNLLDFNLRQRDDLMRWVVQETGFNETSVSAFNEAVNNATGTKVSDAQKWVEDLVNKHKQA